MSSEPVFFSTAFEGLYLKGLTGQLNATGLASLKKVGLDLSKPLQAAYPAATWFEALSVTAQHLGVTHDVLGERLILGLQDTLVGSALFGVARLIGVERTLQRMERNSRSTSNLFRESSSILGPGHAEIRSTLMPEFVGRVPPAKPGDARFLLGVYRGVLAGLGVTGVQVVLEEGELATHSCRIEITWAV